MAKKQGTMNKVNPEKSVSAYAKAVRRRTTKTVNQMAKMLQKEIVKNISKDDGHTYNWLQRQGHPYGKGPGKDRGPIPHKKPFVHKQGSKEDSENMHTHVEIFKGERKDELEVGIDSTKVPYVGAVLYGSTGPNAMIGRNFLSYSLITMNKRFRKMIKKIGKGV